MGSRRSQDRASQARLRPRRGAAPPRCRRARAFEARRSDGEAHARDFVFALCKRERESAVEDVAGTERVDRLYRENRALAQCCSLAPQHVLRALRDSKKCRGEVGDTGERRREIVETCGGAQTLGGKHNVGRDPKEIVGHLRRSVGIKHHGKAAFARRYADRPHEIWKAIVGKHRVGRCHQAGRIAGCHRFEALISVGDDDPIAARVDEDRGQRGGHARHSWTARTVDAVAGQCGKQWSPFESSPVGPPSGPASAARPPSRATATAALAAQPPLTTKKLCAAALVSGPGKRSTLNTSSSTMIPAQRIAGGAARPLLFVGLADHRLVEVVVRFGVFVLGIIVVIGIPRRQRRVGDDDDAAPVG